MTKTDFAADTQVEEINAECKQGLVVCDPSMAIPMHCLPIPNNQGCSLSYPRSKEWMNIEPRIA
jgi:hypothetical protein